MSGPDSSNAESIRHESEGWVFVYPSCRDIFCLKNFDIFKRTSVRVSAITDVARAQLAYQILTLIKKNYLYHQTKYQKVWANKCLALIGQILRAFESTSGRDIFCLKNFETFTRTSVRVSKTNAVARAQLTFQMLTLLQKYVWITGPQWVKSFRLGDACI